MKTLLGIMIGLVLLSLISCEEPSSVKTSEYNGYSKFKKLEDRLPISSGYVSVYTYGTDTLYIIEGRSSSYPVGITIK